MTFTFRAGTLALAVTLVALAGCGSDGPPPVDNGNPALSAEPGAATSGLPDATPAPPAAGRSSASEAGASAVPPTNLLPESTDVPPAKFVKQSVIRNFYEDRKPKIIRHVNVYSDDSQINEGEYLENYPSGQAFVQGNYRNDKRDGDWKYWHENGQIAKTVTYKNENLDGQWEVFREDGTKSSSRVFRDGKRDGTWQSFDPAGEKMIAEQHYENGLLNGTSTSWYPSGEKRSEQSFRNGKRDGKHMEWHENGKPRFEIGFRDGKRHGKMTEWDASGKVVREHLFRDGELVSQQPSENGSSGTSDPADNPASP